MAEGLWLALALVLVLAGMGWLALAMEGHWEQVMCHSTRVPARPCRALRLLASLALLLSLCACLMADRPSMAVLVWIMLLAIGAVGVSLLLAFRPLLLSAWWPAARGRRTF